MAIYNSFGCNRLPVCVTIGFAVASFDSAIHAAAVGATSALIRYVAEKIGRFVLFLEFSCVTH